MEAGPSLVRVLGSTQVYVVRGERGMPEGPVLRAIRVRYGPLLLKLPGLAEVVLVLGYAQGHRRQRVALYLELARGDKAGRWYAGWLVELWGWLVVGLSYEGGSVVLLDVTAHDANLVAVHVGHASLDEGRCPVVVVIG